jgi:ATP-binding cassette, subfamily C, bacterial CydCD
VIVTWPVNEGPHRNSLELTALAQQVRWPVAALVVLGAIRILALPLTAYCVKTNIPLYAPLAAGMILEPLRSALSIVCRRIVRRGAMVGFAAESLDASRLHTSTGATRAAFVAERAVSVNVPGFIAGALATCVLLALSASRLGLGLVSGVMAVLICAAVIGVAWQQRRRPLHHAVVSALIKLGAWMTVASIDQGEVCTDTARGQYYRQVARSSDAWSQAEARLERSRLMLRAGLGLVMATGLSIVLVQGDLPLALRELTALKSRQVLSIADFIVLASALPSLISSARHWDSLLGDRSELVELRPVPRPRPATTQSLGQRPGQLVISNLEVRYESELGVRVEQLQVDLSYPLILLGANGCGKSTLLATIAGVLETTSGTVLIDSIPSETIDRGQIAFVPQDPVLVEALTLLENARLVVPTATPMELGAYLEALGLKCDVQDLLGSLSRGERRRVAIARALLKYPRLLLLDEPDAWLDAQGRQLLLEALGTIQPDTAIIIVTHRLEMAQFGSTIAVLGPDQSLEAVGTLTQLQASSATLRLVVGS